MKLPVVVTRSLVLGKEPFVDFGMAVREGKAGRPIMIGGGQIGPIASPGDDRSRDRSPKVAVINAVGVLVEGDVNVGGIAEVRGLVELPVAGGIAFRAGGPADTAVHRHASDAARPAGLLLDGAQVDVGGAVVDFVVGRVFAQQ